MAISKQRSRFSRFSRSMLLLLGAASLVIAVSSTRDAAIARNTIFTRGFKRYLRIALFTRASLAQIPHGCGKALYIFSHGGSRHSSYKFAGRAPSNMCFSKTQFVSVYPPGDRTLEDKTGTGWWIVAILWAIRPRGRRSAPGTCRAESLRRRRGGRHGISC